MEGPAATPGQRRVTPAGSSYLIALVLGTAVAAVALLQGDDLGDLVFAGVVIILAGIGLRSELRRRGATSVAGELARSGPAARIVLVGFSLGLPLIAIGVSLAQRHVGSLLHILPMTTLGTGLMLRFNETWGKATRH